MANLRPTLTAPAAPAVFQLMAGLWSIPKDLAVCFWAAIAAARWSTVSAWREQWHEYQEFITDPDAEVDTARTSIAMLETLCEPKTVMRMLALLEQERRLLSHAQTVAIAECVLNCLEADGGWKK